MERITPEQVKAAYQETGYKVLRHGYELQHEIRSRDLSVDDTHLPQTERWWRVDHPGDIKVELGLDDDYVDGFIRGFDEGFDSERSERYRRNRRRMTDVTLPEGICMAYATVFVCVVMFRWTSTETLKKSRSKDGSHSRVGRESVRGNQHGTNVSDLWQSDRWRRLPDTRCLRRVLERVAGRAGVLRGGVLRRRVRDG